MVMPQGIIGRCLARAFRPREGLDSVCFPLGTPAAIRMAFVQELNSLARAEGDCEVPYAVEISTSSDLHSWIVHPKVAEEYRAGSRMFAWEEGSYDPSASFASAVSMLLDRDFPGAKNRGPILEHLAREIIGEAKRQKPDAFHPGDWGILESSTRDVLSFVAEAMSLAGNESLETWCAAWWHFADIFAERLRQGIGGIDGLVGAHVMAYASAGLPCPGSRAGYQLLDPGKYLGALLDNWGTTEDAANSCRVLRAMRDGVPSAAEELALDSLDVVRNSLGHVVLAVTTLGSLQTDTHESAIWARFREEDWLLLGAADLDLLGVYVGAAELPLLSERPRPTFLLPALPNGNSTWRLDGSELRLTGLVAKFPAITNAPASPSSFSATCSARDVSVLVTDFFVEDGLCSLGIDVVLTLRKKGKWPTSGVRIKLSGINDTGLAMLAGNDLELALVLPPPADLAATVVTMGSGKRRRLQVCNGPEYMMDSQGLQPVPSSTEPYPLNLEKPETVSIYCVLQGRDATEAKLIVPGQEAVGGSGWPSLLLVEGWKAGDTEQVQLEVGQSSLTLVEVSLGSDVPRPWLPLAATAQGVSPRSMSDSPPGDLISSLRGELETSLWNLLQDFNAGKVSLRDLGLGQAILPEGLSHTWVNNGLTLADGVPWMASVPKPARQLVHAGSGPSEQLLLSAEYAQFWKVAGRVFDAAGKNIEPSNTAWFCRCSLLPLGRALVDEYLDAYAELVGRADSISSSDSFWARYPFSFPVVNSATQELRAILVSPLHPVRTGWLYGAEYAARASFKADHPASLLQVIEGWNFPWIGQAPAPKGNVVVMSAVPVDLGAERMFIGWSMLCAFNNAGSSLTVPTWAAGKRLPGSSSSGLSEGGIGAALRDFKRVHPNLSSLAIDLYSASHAPRSQSIDSAITNVISEFAVASDAPGRLIGGVRIYDSLNRDGSPPISEEILGSAGEPAGAPISWVRYNPEDPPASHLRFVENSSAHVTRVPGSRLGWIPPLPVRRFAGFSGEKLEDLNPVLQRAPGEVSWNAYARALGAVEEAIGNSANGEAPVSALRLEGGATFFGGNSTPRWTVTGNVQSSPAAIAREVARNGQMLWEWRPGFLPRKSTTDVLGTQPYTTVASIPRAFRRALAQQLDLDSASVDKILATLGSRGVGLASLMAMGTTHVSGALGFYLGYSFIERLVAGPDLVARLVAPIDAVDALMRSVVPDQQIDETKRADLLIIEIPCSETDPIIFRPVEIRCSPTGQAAFPGVGSNAVARKVEQLSQSIAVTKKAIMASRLGYGPDDGGSLLARCAMSAIVECGSLLTPAKHDSASIARALARIASGMVNIEVGRSLVFWFQRTAERMGHFHGDAPLPDIGTVFLDIELSLGEDSDHQAMVELIANEVSAWLDGRGRNVPSLPADSIPAKPGFRREDQAREVAAPLPSAEVSAKTQASETVQKRSAEQPEVAEAPVRPIVELGAAVDGTPVKWDPYHPARKLTNGHVVVLGSSGSGKTQTLKSFVDQLCRQGVVPLLLDFNDDYIEQDYLGRLGARCFDAMDGLPFNPLEPELDTYSGKLNIEKQVFQVSGVLKNVYGLGVQQEASLRKALKTAYDEAGVTAERGRGIPAPEFSRVGELLEDAGEKTVVNRLSPIFQLGLFRPGTTSLEKLIATPAVVRLSQLPNEEVKRAAAELILRSLYNSILHLGHSHGLRYVIVIDEAHKIANLGAVKTLLKEARKYGVSVVLSSQEARDFEDYVFSNAGSLLSLKLSETNDSARVARLMTGSREAAELAEELRSLPQFKGILRNDHYNQPFVRLDVLPYFKLVAQSNHG